MKPKTKTTTVCINEEELKKSSVKVQDPYPHTEKSEDPKKTNPGCAVLIIFMILIYFIYKCCVK